ncbi:MAG: hypothetical protein IJG13_23420 [Kiritimatiellae bacterium]|nr:hypothetical protein [Kiritimatiellia bacterium]MBQ3343254.1 hypothetical protein [Kiritimatiellia bacterium]
MLWFSFVKPVRAFSWTAQAAFVSRCLADGRQAAMPECRTEKVEGLRAVAAFRYRNRRNAPVGKATGFRGRA